MRISELETPALLVDLDIMEANLARVAAYALEHGLRLRPHTKTHKIPALGRRQLEHDAIGLTVAKVGEAEVMVDSGVADLLVAYPVVGRTKLERLMEVAKKTRITVALDSLAVAQPLSDAARAAQVQVDVFVEVDAGMGRVGVAPADLVPLAKAVHNLPHLKLTGFNFYPGHIKAPDEIGLAALAKVSDIVSALIAEFRAADLPVDVVSGGSTPALYHSHRVKGLTEIRPGTYIFNDRNTAEAGGCGWEDCAATILTTVVSRRPGHIIVDGGSKTFSSDRTSGPGDPTFGLVREAPGSLFYKMNEEHGYIDLRQAARQDFAVGERVRILPNHICVAVNLHEHIYGIRGDQVVETWKVAARGKLQ
ncbi:MAG: D-TA family PLP-dependent enzyme [Acidobacteria bacterium]|nr:D-TA family PLP-dependent enzyme [Acidobacteriota bacterium]